MSAVYRIRQFMRAAGALMRPVDGEALASRHLPPAAASLFLAMPRYDRQHALGVLHTLRVQGHVEPELFAAALLHDVGKTHQSHGELRLWHRVATVLMRAFWPGLLDRIGEEQPGSWRYPFFVQQQHAAISAELAQGVGCSAAVVELIRRHEDPPEEVDDPLLSALQTADSLN